MIVINLNYGYRWHYKIKESSYNLNKIRSGFRMSSNRSTAILALGYRAVTTVRSLLESVRSKFRYTVKWVDTGFVLVIWYIEHLQIVVTTVLSLIHTLYSLVQHALNVLKSAVSSRLSPGNIPNVLNSCFRVPRLRSSLAGTYLIIS
jgi:hypothetical protein